LCASDWIISTAFHDSFSNLTSTLHGIRCIRTERRECLCAALANAKLFAHAFMCLKQDFIIIRAGKPGTGTNFYENGVQKTGISTTV